MFLSFHIARGQTVTSAASLAAPLENLEGSARDLSMGSAFVGVADDLSSLFFNTAGLSCLQRSEVALHHNSYLAGTFQETLTAGFPVGDMGGIAFALDYINWGTLDLRDSFGQSQGSYNDSDVGFTAGWGKEWAKGFSTGLSLRALQQKVVNDLYTSLAGDLGLLWSPVQDLRLGASYLNLGTPVAGSSLSQELLLGSSLKLAFSRDFSLLTALSGTYTPGSVGSGQCGLEGVLNRQWALRLGYQIPFYNDQVGGLTGFTAGAGLRVDALSLDYAYLPFGTLGTSNRISLSYQFDLPKEVVKVQVPVTVVQPAPAAANPKDVEVHFKVQSDPLADGQALEKAGKISDAIQVYVDAIKADPSNDSLWSALGRDYYQLGNRDYAIQCFEKSLQLKPDPALEQWLEKYKSQKSSP